MFSLTKHADTSSTTFVAGLFVLFVAQLLGALMGVYVETTYARYGRHWQQNLFYSHLLGLLPSLTLYPLLVPQLTRLWSGPAPNMRMPLAAQQFAAHYLPSTLEAVRNTPVLGRVAARHLQSHHRHTPPGLGATVSSNFAVAEAASDSDALLSQAMLLLLLNSFTQIICITGVNRLSAQTTALTVTIVLNVRKLVSFLLSCFLFGNKLSTNMAIGALIVFGSGAVYGWDGSRKKSRASPIDGSKSSSSRSQSQTQSQIPRAGQAAGSAARSTLENSRSLSPATSRSERRRYPSRNRQAAANGFYDEGNGHVKGLGLQHVDANGVGARAGKQA